MELLDEIIASRNIGKRRVDPNRGGWEDMGIEVALKQPSLLRRYDKTIAFITTTVPIGTLQQSTILDSGEPNPFTYWLERNHKIRVSNTPPDLDFDYCHRETHVAQSFDYVFALEILEHLMNPLAFLEYLVARLKPDGRIFLSTPFVRPRFLWSKYHVTEYFPDKIEEMAAKSGLSILRYKRANVYPFTAGLLGIRPLFRLWFERIMFFEMAKLHRH
jgi:SAM-dependent methyltransferase